MVWECLWFEKNDNGDELWNQREAEKAAALPWDNHKLNKYDEN